MRDGWLLLSLHWRHNDHDAVLNHQPHGCLLNLYSDADQRKHQSSASLAFVWGIHRDRWIPRTKGQLRGKFFHLMTSSCYVQGQTIPPEALEFKALGFGDAHMRQITGSNLGHVMALILFGAKPLFNSLRPRRNRRHFADDIFKIIFVNEIALILIKLSLKFVPKGSMNNITALVQIMVWRRPGDKPLSEPMLVRIPTHICVARPQWVKPFLHIAKWKPDVQSKT